MQYEWIIALILLCSIAIITPGPNNFIVLSGSIHKWIKRTLPAYFGICIWFPLMTLIVAYITSLIWNEIFEKISFIKYFGIAFLLYLSYKIFFSEKTDKKSLSDTSNDITFLQMFLFQWMNPKAWAMVMSTVSLVGIEYYYLPGIIFWIIAFPTVWIWLLLWNFIGKKVLWTKHEVYINKAMAFLLVCSVYFMI